MREPTPHPAPGGLCRPRNHGRHRVWLGEPCRIAARLPVGAYAAALPGARPELILFVQNLPIR